MDTRIVVLWMGCDKGLRAFARAKGRRSVEAIVRCGSVDDKMVITSCTSKKQCQTLSTRCHHVIVVEFLRNNGDAQW